jgi:hypothetical protein
VEDAIGGGLQDARRLRAGSDDLDLLGDVEVA